MEREHKKSCKTTFTWFFENRAWHKASNGSNRNKKMNPLQSFIKKEKKMFVLPAITEGLSMHMESIISNCCTLTGNQNLFT